VHDLARGLLAAQHGALHDRAQAGREATALERERQVLEHLHARSVGR
jgi:hypothetical protein